MKFIIKREDLLEPLQTVAGVVERRQTLPVLSNVLLVLKKGILSLTGTDLEMELQGEIQLDSTDKDGATTVPARKFIDICRALPEQSLIEIIYEEPKLLIRAGKSRFSLMTIPAADFPVTEAAADQFNFSISQRELKKLIERTQFAVAQQDVRYYLNGLLLELANNSLRAVATDGHRLALSAIGAEVEGDAQVILPRKGVIELMRLLDDHPSDINVSFAANQIRVYRDSFVFTTKLIDSRYPDYRSAIPSGSDRIMLVDRDVLKQALSRVAVISGEQHRSVRLELQPNLLLLNTTTSEQEVADEELVVDYQGDYLDIAFNVNYLIDGLGALPAGTVKLIFTDSDSGVRMESDQAQNDIQVVMPMRI